MKSKHFASICTGTSNAFRRRAGTRSVGIPQGSACAYVFILETHAPFSEMPSAQALPQMNGSGMVRNLCAANDSHFVVLLHWQIMAVAM
jgi:hypothetical protein